MAAQVREEIRALTGLRGVAALAVVLQHYSATAQTVTGTTIPSLAPHGYMAVDFFFVLSGFIMSYNYLGDFQARGWRAYPKFLIRRLARIWPLQAAVVITLLLIAAVTLAAGGNPRPFVDLHSPLDIASNLMMLQGFGIGQNLNGPSGTVSQELGAYALFPILLAITSSRWRSVVVCGFAAALALLCWQALQEPRLGLSSREVYNNVFRCFSEFTLGIGAHRFYLSSHRRWCEGNWFAAVTAGACLLSLSLRVDLPAALMFPALVVAFAANRGWPARLVEQHWLHLLGVISYSLYLIHSPIRFAEFTILKAFHPSQFSAPEALTIAGAGAMTTIPLAWLCYHLVEHPGRDLVRRVLEPRRGKTMRMIGAERRGVASISSVGALGGMPAGADAPSDEAKRHRHIGRETSS